MQLRFKYGLSLFSIVIILAFLCSCGQNDMLFCENKLEIEEDKEYTTALRYDEKTGVSVLQYGEQILFDNCDQTTSKYTLPTVFNDFKITRTGEGALSGNDVLVELIVPDGYEGIDYLAFSNCKNLERVYLGKDVTWIWYRAFSECPKLSKFSVSLENPHFYENDGCVLTKQDDILVATNGIIPEGTRIIGGSVFGGNTTVSEIIIPEGVEEIQGYAFDRSSVSKVTLPESLKKIGVYAFSQCANLKEIYIPESVTEIEDTVFAGNDGLIINCAAELKPEGWHNGWLDGCTNYQLNWGVKNGV